jgi:hypothetical protein
MIYIFVFDIYYLILSHYLEENARRSFNKINSFDLIVTVCICSFLFICLFNSSLILCLYESLN